MYSRAFEKNPVFFWGVLGWEGVTYEQKEKGGEGQRRGKGEKREGERGKYTCRDVATFCYAYLAPRRHDTSLYSAQRGRQTPPPHLVNATSGLVGSSEGANGGGFLA